LIQELFQIGNGVKNFIEFKLQKLKNSLGFFVFRKKLLATLAYLL